MVEGDAFEKFERYCIALPKPQIQVAGELNRSRPSNRSSQELAMLSRIELPQAENVTVSQQVDDELEQQELDHRDRRGNLAYPLLSNNEMRPNTNNNDSPGQGQGFRGGWHTFRTP